MGEEIMNLYFIAKKLVIYSQEKKLAIIGKTKTIASFFKSIV
jgi:hypothetical protein